MIRDQGKESVGQKAAGQREKNSLITNQSPKGIKWSAVPLPCLTVVFYFVAPIGDEVL